MTGSAIEGCEEATSPPPLLTKEGDTRKLSPMFYPCQSRKKHYEKDVVQKTLLGSYGNLANGVNKKK